MQPWPFALGLPWYASKCAVYILSCNMLCLLTSINIFYSELRMGKSCLKQNIFLIFCEFRLVYYNVRCSIKLQKVVYPNIQVRGQGFPRVLSTRNRIMSYPVILQKLLNKV